MLTIDCDFLSMTSIDSQAIVLECFQDGLAHHHHHHLVKRQKRYLNQCESTKKKENSNKKSTEKTPCLSFHIEITSVRFSHKFYGFDAC